MKRFAASFVLSLMLSSSALAGDFLLKFKAYDQPNAEVTPFCDLHVNVALSSEGNTFLTLKNVVLGTCEISVDEDKRTYSMVSQGKDSCGSVKWVSEEAYVGDRVVEDRSVVLFDNRERICESGGTWQSSFNVVETTANGEIHLFSNEESIEDSRYP